MNRYIAVLFINIYTARTNQSSDLARGHYDRDYSVNITLKYTYFTPPES
jgi:hypothetical protein